ncbi:MAG: PIN domain-containing protein [Candidatus Nanopelagicales bacterium]
MGALNVAMRQRTVLDTSVLIGGTPASLEGEVAISAASLAELHFGVHVPTDPEVRAKRLARLATIEREFEALAFDSAVATSYGLLAALTLRAGRQPRRRAFDLLIAATAHAHHASLATRDLNDFEHLSEHVRIIEVG